VEVRQMPVGFLLAVGVVFVVALFGLVFFLSFSALISLATPVRHANWV